MCRDCLYCIVCMGQAQRGSLGLQYGFNKVSRQVLKNMQKNC